MKHMISALFSPMAFALGFLWPLSWQVVATLELAQAGLPAIVAGAAILGHRGGCASVDGRL